MTQIQQARKGITTDEMITVAKAEGISPDTLREHVAKGHVVIPANLVHLSKNLVPIGIGRPLTTKVNANIGASSLASDREHELNKLRVALKYGADTVMDLSTGGDVDLCRSTLINESTAPIGTVPLYEMIINRRIEDLTTKDILDTCLKQAEQGVDFFTIHAGVLNEHIPLVEKRLAGCVSRGGSLLLKWMSHHNKQNPFYEVFDDLCGIMSEYDVSFSLGDGLRPGAIADATDEAQIAELKVLGSLTTRAKEKGCQVIVEGPGHVPFDQIERNMKMQIEICDGAPFYVLGPIVTDVAPGYDHITSAIGATAAAFHGASFICYVTPTEHLGLPCEEHVKDGVIASRIAAHAADVALGLPNARKWDDRISAARTGLDWEKHLSLAMDPETAGNMRKKMKAEDTDHCSMCGKEWCSVRINRDLFHSSGK